MERAVPNSGEGLKGSELGAVKLTATNWTGLVGSRNLRQEMDQIILELLVGYHC
jgi:hypothetical protein